MYTNTRSIEAEQQACSVPTPEVGLWGTVRKKYIGQI